MSPALWDASRRRDAAAWAGPLHVASLVAAFGFLLWVNRRQWFNLDEWNFLVDRHAFAGDGTSIWEPHNEHWSTTPVLVYRGLFAVFGVRTYLPYVLVNVAFHLLVVHLVWRLLRRNGVEPLLATCACAVLAVLGAGWENLTSAFQYQFFGPILFGLLALLVAPERGGLARRDALVAVLLVIGLTFSGTGLTMVVVVALVTLLRRGARVAAATVAVPALVYLLWYLAYGEDASTSVPQLSFTTTLEVLPGYVWQGLVGAVDEVTGLAGVGPVVLVLLGLAVVRLARPATSAWAVTLALAFGAVTFLTLTGIRRASLGEETAGAPRYVYVIAVLLLPLAAMAVDRWSSGSQVRLVMMVGVTALLLIVQTTQLNSKANDWAVIEQEQKHRIMAAAELAREGERFVFQAPVPQFIPNLTIDEVAALDRDGKLPGNVEVSETDRLTARAYLQLDLAPIATLPAREPFPRLVRVDGADVTTTADPACVRLEPVSSDPSAVVDFSVPGAVHVTSERDGELTASVRDHDGNHGRERPFSVTEGEEQVLNVTAAGFSVRLRVPTSGATELCGFQPSSMPSV
ncbi:MAG: hypothetical protein ACRDY6_02070 [Acidimicrobiia bacterium]